MEIETRATLLTAESKPYNFDGKVGTSYKVRLNVAGEIYVCKSSPEQVTELQEKLGEDGDAIFKLESRKENLSLKLVSFK